MKEAIIGVVTVLLGMAVGCGLFYGGVRMGIRIGWDAANTNEPLKKASPPLAITDTE